jgi:hypothetical protein
MSVTIKKYEKTFDSTAFPGLNPAQFSRMIESELQLFLKTLFNLDCEFVAQQDLTKMGVATKFYTINEYAAVRQITHYTPQDNSFYVRFDAAVIVTDDPVEKLPGEDKPSHNTVDTASGAVAATESVH